MTTAPQYRRTSQYRTRDAPTQQRQSPLELLAIYHTSNEKLDKASLKPAQREEWALQAGYTSWLDATQHLNRRAVRVYMFNLPAHTTCPGESPFCTCCYADRGRTGMAQECYARNLNIITSQPKIIYQATMAIPHGAWLRIHTSGDYHTRRYIQDWTAALHERPDIHAWSYTRSWRINTLQDALEELRNLPNMQLFASTDPTITETPPARWRIAYINGDQRANGYTCPEQTELKADCKDCGYCILGRRGDVIFERH